MSYITFEEAKEILKKSIDETTNINEALEKTVQFIYSKGYEDGSRRLPAAPSTDGWIPCSERLPSKNGKYIVTEKRYAVDDKNHDGKYDVIVEEVYWCGKWDRAKFFEVTAWMFLPEPYNEGEQNG